MPLQNRVTPQGDIIAVAARGTLMGNRGGRLHRPDRTLMARRWASRAWICCQLAFKDRHRTVMAPNSYTELFFLDEATALAAGHRPCFECRRGPARQFAAAAARGLGLAAIPSADALDRRLHIERAVSAPARSVWIACLGDLPDGVMVSLQTDAAPALLWGGRLWPWTPSGYGAALPSDPDATHRVLTPPTTAAALGAGYVPMVQCSAEWKLDGRARRGTDRAVRGSSR